MNKLVYFHPKLNNPPLYGSQASSFEMLTELKNVGFKVYLFVIETTAEPILNKEGSWGFEKVYFCNQTDRMKIRQELSQYIEKVNPKVIFMNYPAWDDVLDHEKFSQIKRVIYNHHFESIRKKMFKDYVDAWKKINPTTVEELNDELTDPTFYLNKEFNADEEEYQVYDRYDYTLAIQDIGLKQIQKHCQKTKILPVTATINTCSKSSSYQTFAIFPVGTNYFNLQGYCFFVKNVMPKILAKNPFFYVRVLGVCSQYYLQAPNVLLKGFVPNLFDEYLKARFLISPVFAGTGQQIKILEAMSCGLPVVAMQNPMQHIPFEHGKEGFIATSADEFANYCLLLYSDVNLVKKMGEEARTTIEQKYSSSMLGEVFKQLL